MSLSDGRPPTGSPSPASMPRAFARMRNASPANGTTPSTTASQETEPSAKNTTWSTGNANVQVSTGYKTNEIGFGWTNAVYLKMRQIMTEPASLPAN